MRTQWRQVAAVVAMTFAGLFSPAAARADVVLTPFAGVSFGGEAPKKHAAFGGALTFIGNGVFGFEIDGALSPNLLDGDAESLDLSLGDTSVGTLMANIVIAAPAGAGGIRPYISGGAGLLRVSIDSPLDVLDLTEDSFGVNVGAGIIAAMSDRVGLRADIRYFRRLQDSDASSGIDLTWEASISGVARWGCPCGFDPCTKSGGNRLSAVA